MLAVLFLTGGEAHHIKKTQPSGTRMMSLIEKIMQRLPDSGPGSYDYDCPLECDDGGGLSCCPWGAPDWVCCDEFDPEDCAPTYDGCYGYE